MDGKNIPLSVMLENAKSQMTAAFSQIAQNTQLPAYLLEGIIAGILADIRKQESIELANDLERMRQVKANEENKSESEEKTDG